ncbi:Lengsin [Manis pentadactyla]|nr:Lengsin [Manis pentadactyla]
MDIFHWVMRHVHISRNDQERLLCKYGAHHCAELASFPDAPAVCWKRSPVEADGRLKIALFLVSMEKCVYQALMLSHINRL